MTRLKSCKILDKTMTLFEFQLIYLYCKGEGGKLVGKIEIPAATSLLQKVEKRDFLMAVN